MEDMFFGPEKADLRGLKIYVKLQTILEKCNYLSKIRR